METQNGDFIKVRAFGGQVSTRRFVEIRDEFVLVTTNEEFEAAAREHREPICIGFPIEDVIEQGEESN